MTHQLEHGDVFLVQKMVSGAHLLHQKHIPMLQLVRRRSTQHLVWRHLFVWNTGVRPGIHKDLQQGSIVNLYMCTWFRQDTVDSHRESTRVCCVVVKRLRHVTTCHGWHISGTNLKDCASWVVKVLADLIVHTSICVVLADVAA